MNMSRINPYEPPNSFDHGKSPNPLQYGIGLARVIGLVAAGYIIYFTGVYIAAQIEPSVSLSESSWTWGSIVAFACASSELFYIRALGLRTSLTRRLIVSVALTVVSLVVAGPLCTLAGFELRRDRTAVIVPRLGIGIPIFAVLAVAVRRWLMPSEHGEN